MIEESNLIYHAEKNPELIGKDVSLIPWYISPKIAFLRGHTISFLRKIRISSLHSLGSTIRSFHISKPKPGQPFSDFEQSYEIEISNQAMMLKEISGLLIEEERKAGLPTLKERNKHNIPMTFPSLLGATLEFFVNEMLVESNIL